MKLKDGIVISEINGEYVAVPSGAASREFSGMIRMNKTAAQIAMLLREGKNEDDVVAALCDMYEVEEAIAREDYVAVTAQLEKLGLLEA